MNANCAREIADVWRGGALRTLPTHGRYQHRLASFVDPAHGRVTKQIAADQKRFLGDRYGVVFQPVKGYRQELRPPLGHEGDDTQILHQLRKPASDQMQ